MAEKGIMHKLATIDYRYIYAIMTLAVALPLIYPIGVPMHVGDNVKNYAKTIESLKSGDKVLVYFSGYATMLPDVEPIYMTTWKMLLTKDIKMYILLTHPDSQIVIENELNNVLKANQNYGKTYGEDYICFPYIDITEAVELAFAENIGTVFTKDMYNTPLSSLSIMDSVQNAESFDLLIALTPDTAVRRYAVPYHTKIICWGTGTGLLPFVPPYYNPDTGPIYGYVGGASQGGELEKFTGFFGDGVRYNDAKNLGMLGLVVIVIIANVADFASKKGGNV